MKYIIRGLIVCLFCCFFFQSVLATTYIWANSPLTAFQNLGILLTEKIANTYYTGDWLLIQWRVINKKEHAFFYLQNIKTKEEITRLVPVDSNWNFRIPVSLPKTVWKYYFIIASGNSFESSSPEYMTLVPNNRVTTNSITPGFLFPKIVYDESPYISVGSDKWVQMRVEQAGKTYDTSGKILMMEDSGLNLGNARVSISWYWLSNVSSLDIISTQPFNWNGNIIIDRTRDRIGENIPTLRIQRSMGTMQFRVKNWEKVESHYFVTTPKGNVIKYTFPSSMISSNWFLRTNINIRQNFPMPESGVYKIETVKSNGIAFFNLPISKSQFWSIIEPMTQLQKLTLRTDIATIETSINRKINIIRAWLLLNSLSKDAKLTNLAQQKAMDMATYDYVWHSTHNGLGILDFGNSIGIKISGSIGENVAWWNISDISLEDWLEESGCHRYNMINPKWRHIGIWYVLKNGKTYLVQLFSE